MLEAKGGNLGYDIIVVGAGPGGSAAAYYLAEAGLKVLLLDKFYFPRDKTCGDALTPLAVTVLAGMGLLAELGQVGCAITGFEIFAPGGHSTVASLPQRKNGPEHALVVPRLTLDNLIRERAVNSGAKFEGGVKVTDIEADTQGVTVRGRGQGRSVSCRARLAIIATGANIGLLQRIGLLTAKPAMMMAARAYFENVADLNDHIRFYFEGISLPGYGWVFPLPNDSANIGAGFFPKTWFTPRRPSTPTEAFKDFIQTPRLQSMLGTARQVGSVKGYPLRTDFTTASTYGERVIMVGEAAGLVNPLTGEGIDYALESGKIAAHHLSQMFESGDLSQQNLAVYDQLLRRRFQSLFKFCYIMQYFLHRPFLNRLVKAATSQPDLQTILANVVLGNQPVSKSIPPKTIIKALLTLAVADFL